MRRILAVILCLFLLSPTVFADNSASAYTTTATVSPTGSCQVVMSVTIRLDQPVPSLLFPLGPDVSNVALNGGHASTTTVGGITCIKLNYLRNQVGTFPIILQYTVPNIVETDEDGVQSVKVPLLSGFKYPVEQMSFNITMPGSFEDEPRFFSGYHEQDIERILDVSVSGVTISGSVTAPLKDSETMYMQLIAPEGMFPLAVEAGESIFFDQIAMGVCTALALLYWLATMRRKPALPGRHPTPPEGLSAGSIGSYLVHANSDLTMMVIHWAQMGYLQIHLDQRDRVILHKKMEMGNERSMFEGKCFASLFSKGNKIDAASGRYARLCQQTADASRRHAAGLLPQSGNPKVFRLLACGVGLFAGVAMGDSIGSSSAVMRVFWMILMAVFSAFACWRIQQGMSRLHLRGKQELFVSLGYAVGLVLVSLLCGAVLYGVIAAVWALLSGFMAAYGGRRTENGLQICMEILGLRRFLRSASAGELQRILRSNPEYFYELAPFALALGVDRRFARQFGAIRLPSCRWLQADSASRRSPEDRMTPVQWCNLLRRTVDLMNRSQQRPLWKILLGIR